VKPVRVKAANRKDGEAQAVINSRYEAVFVSAAQHLLACRHYHEAQLVISACRELVGYRSRTKTELRKLDIVRELCCALFSGYTRVGPVPSPELQVLRSALEELDRTIEEAIVRDHTKFETVYDYIDVISKRPGMYLGRPSLELLAQAIQPPIIPQKKLRRESPSFTGFKRWIEMKYRGVCGSGWSWWMILNTVAGGDEKQGFELFREELKAYRKSRS
jgi:hypothetical protein